MSEISDMMFINKITDCKIDLFVCVLFVLFIHPTRPHVKACGNLSTVGFQSISMRSFSEHALISTQQFRSICFICYEISFFKSLLNFWIVWLFKCLSQIFRIVCFFDDFQFEIYLSFVFFVFSDCFLFCSKFIKLLFPFIMIMLSFDRWNCYMYDDPHIFENAMFLIINRFQPMFRFRNRRRCRCLIDYKLRWNVWIETARSCLTKILMLWRQMQKRLKI